MYLNVTENIEIYGDIGRIQYSITLFSKYHNRPNDKNQMRRLFFPGSNTLTTTFFSRKLREHSTGCHHGFITARYLRFASRRAGSSVSVMI